MIGVLICIIIVLLAVIINLLNKYAKIKTYYNTEYASTELLIHTINQMDNKIGEDELMSYLVNAYKICVNNKVFEIVSDINISDYNKAAEFMYNEIKKHSSER